MADYLDEEELKEEISKVQKTQRLQELYYQREELEKYAKYNWELKELESIIEEIQQIEENDGDVNYSLDKFGGMVLLLLKRIMSRPNFSGYSWKEDFYSDATEKIIKYIHNFNPNLTSTITGKPVKAFAYLTQIANHSFISVINKHKAEIDMMRDLIPLMSYDPVTEYHHYKGIQYTKESEEENVIDWKIDIDIRDQIDPPYIHNHKEYNSIFELILNTYIKEESYKLLMHKDIVIPIDDYNEILNLNISPLNITRHQFKASFPKKKRTKLTVEETWINEMQELVDNIEDDISSDLLD